MIRVAKAADTMAVIRLMQEAHSRSRYSESGDVDPEVAKKFLARCVHFHGNSGDGATFYLVAETDGKLTGFFIGCLGRVYVVGDKFEAQDVHFYLTDGADPLDFRRIIQAFDTWASANPDVIEVTLSTSDYIAGAALRLAGFYRARGFELTNKVFKRRIERE